MRKSAVILILSLLSVASVPAFAHSSGRCLTDYEAWQRCGDPAQYQAYLDALCSSGATVSAALTNPINRQNASQCAGKTAAQCCREAMASRGAPARDTCMAYYKGVCGGGRSYGGGGRQ